MNDCKKSSILSLSSTTSTFEIIFGDKVLSQMSTTWWPSRVTRTNGMHLSIVANTSSYKLYHILTIKYWYYDRLSINFLLNYLSWWIKWKFACYSLRPWHNYCYRNAACWWGLRYISKLLFTWSFQQFQFLK